MQHRDDEAGKSGARPEIQPGRRLGGGMNEKLSRIDDVACPDLFQRRARHEILPLVLRPQKVNKVLQAPQCFTRSEEHTSELQSLMRISYAVFCLKKKIKISHDISLHLKYTNEILKS